MLNESGDKIEQADKDSLTEKVKALRETISKGDVSAIKTETEALQKSMYEVSSKLYQNAAAAQQAAQAQAGAQTDPNSTSNGPDGNVYNADFKDVDNNK